MLYSADAEQLIEQDGVFYTDQNDDHILEGLDVQESSIAKSNALTMGPNGETKKGTYFISPDIPMSPGAYFAQYSAPLEKEAMIREFVSIKYKNSTFNIYLRFNFQYSRVLHLQQPKIIETTYQALRKLHC